MQYDESDLDFVQRLMEHEGIFYFFEYAEDGHTLVLTDAIAKLKPAEGYETVPFHFEDEPARRDRDFLSRLGGDELGAAGRLCPHRLRLREAEPVADGAVRAPSRCAGAFTGEHYRQPGAHLELDRGDAVAAIRREELQAPHVRVRAGGTVRGLASGCMFKLEGFPRDDQNDEHLVLRADYRRGRPRVPHRRSAPDGETYRVDAGGGADGAALPAAAADAAAGDARAADRDGGRAGGRGDLHRQVRPGEGAVPLGPPGQADENSPCFVRVSAGLGRARGWGFIQIPRIGQEVIVDFIEGDPDRPIITGRVYNAAADAALRPAGQRDAVGLEVELLARRRRLQRADASRTRRGRSWSTSRREKDHALLVKNDRAEAGAARPDRPDRQQRQALGRGEPRRGRRQQQDDQGRRRPHGRRSARTTPRRSATTAR